MNISLLLIATAIAGLQANGKPDDWFWSEDQATLTQSMMEVKKPFVASLRAVDRAQLLEISEGTRIAASVPTHRYSVFLIKDARLFVADFPYMSSGCAVECFDLKRGKSLWRSDLKALGPISHSKYYNRVLMRFEGSSLVVYGKESAGRYRETLDTKSGKTLENKIYQKLVPKSLD